MKIKLTSAFRIRKIENILLTRVLKFYAQYLALIFLVSSLIHYRKEITIKRPNGEIVLPFPFK